VNYWYAHPVGHAIEGLRYALGYATANPAMKVSLLLNAATPVELAGYCPFLEHAYAIPFVHFPQAVGDPTKALAGVPREWDHVVVNHRAFEKSHDGYEGFRRFFDAAHVHLKPRHPFGICGAEPPAYLPHQRLVLELPEGSRRTARRRLGEGGRAISVILAGNSRHSLYPSVASWIRILRELSARWPEATIILIGKYGTENLHSKSRISPAEVGRILEAVPAAIDVFDEPLADQLTLVEASDLFLSLHSGFGFAAVSVGAPWLTLSGGDWHEMFFNGVPCYSVLPDTRRYPCLTWGAPMPRIEEDEDGEGPRVSRMSAARVREDLPELLHAAELLIERELPYERALAEYFPRLLAAYDGD
jgi:hypothetical protein